MSLILSISEYEKALDNAGLLQKCLLKEKFSETVSLVTYDSREVVAGKAQAFPQSSYPT